MQTPQTRPPRPVYWMGQTQLCELCQQPLGNTLVDGAIRSTGKWAVLDLRCHRINGKGIGPSMGELYQRQPDGRWLKVEG